MRIARAALPVVLSSLTCASAARADIVFPPAPPKVEVTLAVEKPLSLVKGRGEKEARLSGKVVATLRNTSDEPVKIRDLQEHGLVFVSGKGELTVVVHSCKCVQDAAEPEKAVAVIAPGKERKVTVDDWSCGGGSWPAPAPGRYQLEYRVLGVPNRLPEKAKPDPKVQVPACQRDLAAQWFWESAVRSKPVDVELKAPPQAKPAPPRP